MARERAAKAQTGRTSICAIATKDGARRRNENFQIEPQRPGLAIAEIQAHHIVKSGPASTAHLPQSGNARLNVQDSPPVPDIVNFKFVGNRRPRSDEGHFAAQNIPKLRKLVQAGFPEECADRSHSRIIYDLVYRLLRFILLTAFFLAGNKLLNEFLVNLRIVIRKHRPELQTFKAGAEPAQALLLENHGTL